MKTYWNYKEEDSTFLLNQFLNGVLPAGVYCGFDAVPFFGNMLLQLTQAQAVEEISVTGQSKRIGVIKTKQGVIVAEDGTISTNIDPTTTLPRIDVLVLQHQYQAVLNGSVPFYSVIKGTPSATPTAPFLLIPAYQVKIGEIYLPAGCTALNAPNVEWRKELSPIVYRTKKTHIELRRDFLATQQPLPTGSGGLGAHFLNFLEVDDELGEFLVASGEFTASEAGVYCVHFSARVDYNHGNGFQIAVQFWNGTIWGNIASSLRNIESMQGAISTSCVKKLKKGQKIRLILYTFGAENKLLWDTYASLSRID